MLGSMGMRSAREATAVPRLSRWRMVCAHAVILVVVTGQVLSVLLDVELWPFSPYPMYSTIRAEYRLDRPILYAVVDDAAGTEVPVREIAFFTTGRAHSELIVAYALAPDTPDLRAALADLLARYEAGRQDGRIAGPPLRALRLYDATWHLAAGPGDLAAPDERELILEVARGARRGD